MIWEQRRILLRLFLRATSITSVQYSLIWVLVEMQSKEKVSFFVPLVKPRHPETKKEKSKINNSPRVLVDLVGGVEELDLVADGFHPGGLPDLDL